jgi:hypothetical protein
VEDAVRQVAQAVPAGIGGAVLLAGDLHLGFTSAPSCLRVFNSL